MILKSLLSSLEREITNVQARLADIRKLVEQQKLCPERRDLQGHLAEVEADILTALHSMEAARTAERAMRAALRSPQ